MFLSTIIDENIGIYAIISHVITVSNNVQCKYNVFGKRQHKIKMKTTHSRGEKFNQDEQQINHFPPCLVTMTCIHSTIIISK